MVPSIMGLRRQPVLARVLALLFSTLLLLGTATGCGDDASETRLGEKHGLQKKSPPSIPVSWDGPFHPVKLDAIMGLYRVQLREKPGQEYDLTPSEDMAILIAISVHFGIPVWLNISKSGMILGVRVIKRGVGHWVDGRSLP